MKYLRTFKKLFVRSSGELAAESVKNLYTYGSLDRTMERELEDRIKSIEDEIVREASTGKRILTRVHEKDMFIISESLKHHFEEKGFIANIHKEEGIEDFHVLVIGW